MIHPSAYMHPTVIQEDNLTLGEGVKVWHFCHLRKGSVLGDFVSLGRDVYVDRDVHIGRGSRVQNGVSLYEGVTVGEWCFIGPKAIFTNDTRPRVGKHSWKLEKTVLHNGMSIGAGAVILCGIEIGAYAMVAAGAIVTKSVPPFTLARGMPAEISSMICACGETRLPFDTAELILSCCKQNLTPEVLVIAEKEAAKVLQQS